mmetsp:Transcript_23408/g.74593  ORF Transcript_23408/g.74593 Transcript_23408/m.74593 type:complete len:228 (-) Transcript_23408:662-1345(-)
MRRRVGEGLKQQVDPVRGRRILANKGQANKEARVVNLAILVRVEQVEGLAHRVGERDAERPRELLDVHPARLLDSRVRAKAAQEAFGLLQVEVMQLDVAELKVEGPGVELGLVRGHGEKGVLVRVLGGGDAKLARHVLTDVLGVELRVGLLLLVGRVDGKVSHAAAVVELREEAQDQVDARAATRPGRVEVHVGPLDEDRLDGHAGYECALLELDERLAIGAGALRE